MSYFAVCAFAVIAAAIIATIKHLRPEFASLAAAVCGIIIFVYIARSLIPFIEFIKNVSDEGNVSSYFALMLKALAISLCCRMCSEICRDCGENSLASKVEMAGKVGIVLISLPIIQQLFNIAKDMMQ